MARVTVGTTDNPADQARLAVLISDYEMARDDERTHVATMAAMIGVAVALATAVVAVISQTCQFTEKADCIKADDALLAATPLPTLAVLAYMQMIGISATIRSYYMRAIEMELQKYATDRLIAVPQLRPASLIGVTTQITSLRRGRLGHRLLSLLIYFCVVVVFGGLALYVALKLERPWQLIMLVTYGLFALLFTVEVMVTAVGGNSLFFKHVAQYAARTVDFRRPEPPLDYERKLWSYLIWPRTADWIKWIIVPVIAGVLLWAGPLRLDRGGLWNALAVWFALEFLIYTARYQWNDMIGLADDAAHPAKKARKRLPMGASQKMMRHNVRWSAGVALTRVALALGVGAALGMPWVMTCLIAAVFGIAIPYEYLRRRPASARPEQTTPVTIAIWITVGLGYVLRAATACWLIGIELEDPRTWLVAGTFGMFGIMFVTLTWVLEASSYCREVGGELQYAPELRAKPQIAALLPYTGRRVVRGRHNVDLADYGDNPILKKRGRLITPWNVAAFITFLLSAPFGALMADRLEMPATDSRLGLIALVTAIATVTLLASGSTKVRWTVVLAGACVLAVSLYSVGLQAGFGIVPWLVFTSCYVFFRAQSYARLTEGVTKMAAHVRHILRTAWKKARAVLVSERTEKLVWETGQSTTDDAFTTSGQAKTSNQA